MDIRRLRQLLTYGWKDSGKIAASMHKGISYRMGIFCDILRCYRVYRMWSNQYVGAKFHLLNDSDRAVQGKRYLAEGRKRDAWQKDFVENRKFLAEYMDARYEIGSRRDRRNKAYRKRYNAGENLLVEYDVNISRQHYLSGKISIGNNVLLAKHVFIDYSGGVTLKDDVQLTNGVIIETHHHAFHSDYTRPRSEIYSEELVIGKGAVIGSRAIILSTCHYIGQYARVGAGAVVTGDVPDFAIVAGVPAKVIRYQDSQTH